METNNENKNILSEPELRFREELKNCVKRIVGAADAKRANDIVAVHVGVAEELLLLAATEREPPRVLGLATTPLSMLNVGCLLP